MTNKDQSTLALLRDGRVLLYLFVGFRLMMLLVYQPFLLNGVERGVTTFGDFQHYFNLASLSSQNKLPYRDYWYEFPPVFPAISLGVYSVSGVSGGFTAYATFLALVMILFDTGNLVLIRRIIGQLYGESAASGVGWVYALLTVPLVFSFWTFEPIVVFSILLALSWLIRGRDTFTPIAIAFGALTKLFPLILLTVIWRFRPIASSIRQTILALVLTGLGIIFMLSVADPFGMPSLLAQFNKASYETVWALLDKNYKTGNFGPIADHFDPVKAYGLQGNRAVIPWWVKTPIFALIGLLIYARTRRRDAKGAVAFAAITITLFFLWSQGWSPQWLMTLVALILLNFPSRDGVLVCLALSLISFGEYPFLFSRTGDTNGAVGPGLLPIYSAIIVLRTIILIGFAFALYRRLRTTEPGAARVR